MSDERAYLSRAVFAFTAITHSSPQDFSTVHWNNTNTHFNRYSQNGDVARINLVGANSHRRLFLYEGR